MARIDSRQKALLVLAGLAVLLVLGVFLIRSGGGEEPEILVKRGEVERPIPGGTIEPGQSAEVRMETNRGTFTIDLSTEADPIAANNFAYLASNGFYNGLGFHRIVPGFVIQGGDPRGDGTGGPGYRVVDAPSGDTTYRFGTVAMAKGPEEPRGTAGSQFFIVTAEEPVELPPDYAVVGRVVRGAATVSGIGRLGGVDERPTATVVIRKATLVEPESN